jgi:hypothetical protein
MTEAVLRWIGRRSFLRGMRGRDTAWYVVAAAAWMVLRARRHDDVVYRTLLRPGERLEVVTRRPDR